MFPQHSNFCCLLGTLQRAATKHSRATQKYICKNHLCRCHLCGADFQIKDIQRWLVHMCSLILQGSRIISLRFVLHTSFLKATSALSNGLHPGMTQHNPCHNLCHNRSQNITESQSVLCNAVSAGLHFPSPHGPSPLRKMVVEEVPRMEAMAERIQTMQKPALGAIMIDSMQHQRKIVEKQ